MRLLIDGYNLLHATDLFGSGKLAGTLQGSREALLKRLADLLSASERRATVIVFDAAGAPPGLPKTQHFDHLTVHFARDHADADAQLEDIIEGHRAPRGLTVVSSDHRVQRAARRRGASYVDSDHWYRDLATRRPRSNHDTPAKPTPAGSAEYWIHEFASEELEQLESEIRHTSDPQIKPKASRRTPHAPPNLEGGAENPFPPGYGEDLLEEE